MAVPPVLASVVRLRPGGIAAGGTSDDCAQAAMLGEEGGSQSLSSSQAWVTRMRPALESAAQQQSVLP